MDAVSRIGVPMTFLRFSLRSMIFLLMLASLTACQDLEKLFSGKDKSEQASSGKAERPVGNPAKDVIEMSTACLFPQAAPPENIDVYAVDGQGWIEQSTQLGSKDPDNIVIEVNVDNAAPVALLLTAKDSARWRIKASERTKIWGVYVSAEAPQRVTGIITPTKFIEHYRNSNDQCGFYWAPEYQVHQLYAFSKQLFGRPYAELPKVIDGAVNIKGIETVPVETAVAQQPISREMPVSPPPAQPKAPKVHIRPPARPMTLNEALRANVIRPGTQLDLERFRSKYRAVNRSERGDRYVDQLQTHRLYVITGDYTFPSDGGYAGANSVILILENGVPYPTGDSGHSPVLDMNTGTCQGRICGF